MAESADEINPLKRQNLGWVRRYPDTLTLLIAFPAS
jgi:hypothetical protein